ncbi:hypothetical protein TNCV_2985571 [Trichonephila clavipes]|nr:hypothetical protein TNCV_2985571 [Trichonephila clavipes]
MCAKRMFIFPPSPPISAIVEKWRLVNKKHFVSPNLQRQILLLLCNERSGGHLSGYVNTHNACIWSLENPHECLRSMGYFNSRRAACPLVRLVEGKERWEAPEHSKGTLPQNWGEIELNHSVTCMVLKATTNDWCHFQPFAMINFVGLVLAFAD